MPAITPPDLRNVRNISSPTETYRKVSMPTVYCKSRCNVTPATVDRSWTPQRYTVIGTSSIPYDYRTLGEDSVLIDDVIVHYAGSHNNDGNVEYMDGSLFPRMDGLPVRVGAIYKQDLSRWCEVMTPDHIRFGYGEGLTVSDVEVDPDKSFDISVFGSDFKEPRKVWSALPEYIIMTIDEYNKFVSKPPFELEAKQVVPDKRKDSWVIARLVVDYEETTTPGSSTWVPPTDNTFLTTQTGAAYTPPTNQHICYISDPNSPYYGRYYSKNSGTGYTEHTTHVPWLWRNNEPFYFKNIGNDTITVWWRSHDTYTGVVWANILVDANGVATSKQISNTIPLSEIDIPSGYKLYIFRIDTGTGNHGGARSYDPGLVFDYGNGNYYYYTGGGIWCTSVPITLAESATYWNDHPENMVSINPGDWDAVWLRGESTGKYGADAVHSPFDTGSGHSSIEIGGNLHTLFFCNIQGSINGLSYLNGVSYLNALWGNPQYYWWTKQYEGAFMSSMLFANETTIADASKLEFPHKTLPVCYHDMFLGCTNMVHGPAELPALQQYVAAYAEMFYGCSSLLESPIIYSNFMNYIQKSLVGFTGDDYIGLTSPGYCSVNGADSDYYIYVSNSCLGDPRLSFALCTNLQEIRSKTCGHFDMSGSAMPLISHGGSIGHDVFTGGISMNQTGVSGSGTIAYIRPYKWSIWYTDRQNSIDAGLIRQNWGGYGSYNDSEVSSYENIDTALSGKYSN